MLSALYSQTQRWRDGRHASLDSGSETGSFDDTPAASTRSSISIGHAGVGVEQASSALGTGSKARRRRGRSKVKKHVSEADVEKQPLIVLNGGIDEKFVPPRKSSALACRHLRENMDMYAKRKLQLSTSSRLKSVMLASHNNSIEGKLPKSLAKTKRQYLPLKSIKSP